jgi:hypothetical protein
VPEAEDTVEPQQDRPSAPQPARDANLGSWPAWSPCWPGDNIHALITSVRRRRRDLVILKALGFGRGQVSQTVARPASTLALVAGLIVLPLGIAGGRWARRLLAEWLGVAAGLVVPPPARAGDRSDSPTTAQSATTCGTGSPPSRPSSPTPLLLYPPRQQRG